MSIYSFDLTSFNSFSLIFSKMKNHRNLPHLPLNLFMILTAFFFSGVHCQYEEIDQENPDCSEQALFSCAYPPDFETLKLIKTQQELNDMCENFNLGIRCINDFAKRCFKPHQRSHFNTLYSGTSMVMHELCTDGPYQKEYLKHAGCMNNATEKFEFCIKRFQERIDGEVKKPSDEISVESVCCSLADYLTCSRTVVRATCGEESETFAAGFLSKMSKAINVAHCNNLTITAETCNASTSTSSNPAFLLLLGFSIFFSHYLCY